MTDECKLGLSALTNRWTYFYPIMFLSYIRWLLDKYKLYSSVINIYLLVFS
jgi:hypothetical protein